MNDHRKPLANLGWITAVVLIAVAALSASGLRVQSLLLNTAALSLSVALTSTIVGTAFAFLLMRSDMPLRGVARTLLLVLLLMPLYLQAAGWDAGFGRQGWYSYSTG